MTGKTFARKLRRQLAASPCVIFVIFMIFMIFVIFMIFMIFMVVELRRVEDEDEDEDEDLKYRFKLKYNYSGYRPNYYTPLVKKLVLCNWPVCIQRY